MICVAFNNGHCHKEALQIYINSTVVSQQEGSGVGPGSWLGLFCVELERSSHVGYLGVLGPKTACRSTD